MSGSIMFANIFNKDGADNDMNLQVIYIDGVLSNIRQNHLLDMRDNPTTLARRYVNYSFKGLHLIFRIYNDALTPNLIEKLYYSRAKKMI